MSSILKKYAKSVSKNSFIFEEDMYNNTLGSLVVTHYILGKLNDDNEPADVNEIKRVWKSLKKKGKVTVKNIDGKSVDKKLDFWIDDEKFIEKALDIFGMAPEWGSFCMVQSEFNVLFLPYIDGQPLPVREDGILPRSAYSGKIYPIMEKKENDDNE